MMFDPIGNFTYSDETRWNPNLAAVSLPGYFSKHFESTRFQLDYLPRRLDDT